MKLCGLIIHLCTPVFSINPFPNPNPHDHVQSLSAAILDYHDHIVM